MPLKKFMSGRVAFNQKKVPKATKKYVQKALDNLVEDKVNSNVQSHTAGGNVALSTAGSIHMVHQIAQGQGATTRIGNVIAPKKLRVAVRFTVTGSQDTTLRYILFASKIAQGIAPTVADVLESPPASQIAPLSGYANLTYSNKKIRVLLDKTVSIDLGKGTTYSRVHWLSKKKLPAKIGFVGTDATAASTGTNSLWMLVISGEATASAPSFTYATQIVFEDA